MDALTDTIPLVKDAAGVYRVGSTRVTLDLVVRGSMKGHRGGDCFVGERKFFAEHGLDS